MYIAENYFKNPIINQFLRMCYHEYIELFTEPTDEGKDMSIY